CRAAGEFDSFGHAAGRLFKVNPHIAAQVGPATHAPAAAPPLAAKHLAENVAERLEDIVDVVEVLAKLLAGGVAKTVVSGPLVAGPEALLLLGSLFSVQPGP